MRSVLWSAAFPDHTFEERVRACAAVGYDSVTVSLEELAGRAGASANEQMRVFAEDHGVGIELLEPVVTWLPVNPRWAMARFTLDDVERLGTGLGLHSLCAIAGRDHGVGPTELQDRFGAMNNRFSMLGWTTCIEFIPMSGVRTLAAAADLIEPYPDAGIILDTWHFFRGEPDFGVLEHVDPRRIRYVQVSDADAEIGSSLSRETYDRRLPGAGAFDLARVLRALQARGALSAIGPEVISPSLHHDDAVTQARVMVQALDELLSAATGLTTAGR